MANWEAMKAKLSGNPSKNTDSDESKKLLWKPKLGVNRVRFIPFPSDDDGVPLNELVDKDLNPFVKLFLHSNEVATWDGKPTVALKTFFKKDPISTFGAELYKDGTKHNDKLLIEKAKTMNLKERNLAVIIDRADNEVTPYFWDFANDSFDLLIDEIYGVNFDDLNEGFDILIKTKADVFRTGGKEYAFNKVIKISLDKEPSKACKKSEILRMYDNFPNPFDMYNVLSYDELEAKLEKYLSNSDDDDEDEGKTISTKPSTKPVKKTIIEDDDEDDEELAPKPVKKKQVFEVEEDEEDDEELVPKPVKKKKVVDEEEEEDDEPVKPKVTQKDFTSLIKNKGKKPVVEDDEDDEIPY
jgi:hypothetical protein